MKVNKINKYVSWYDGSIHNTGELKERVTDMFAFYEGNLMINNVSGGKYDFKANLSFDINTINYCEDAMSLVENYTKHNNESIKISFSR